MLRTMRRAFLLLTVSTAIGIASACTAFDAQNESSVADDAGDAGAEGAVTVESGAAEAAVEAGPSGFCASRTGDVYCEDFDSLLDVATLVPEKSAKGAVALTQAAFMSPTRSLSFTTGTDETPSYAVFKHAVTANQPVRVEADMLFGTLDGSPQTLQSLTLGRKDAAVQLGRVCGTVDAGPVECGFFVAVCLFNVDGSAASLCTSHPVPESASAFMSRNTWTHVALEATFSTKGHFSLFLDNKLIHDMNAQTYPVGAPAAADPTIVTVGVAALQGTPAIQLYVDNVAITLH